MLGKPRILSFSPTRLINSIKHEHSCKILYTYYLLSSANSFGPWSGIRTQIRHDKPSSDDLCKELGPRSKNVGPDLDQNCLTL